MPPTTYKLIPGEQIIPAMHLGRQLRCPQTANQEKTNLPAAQPRSARIMVRRHGNSGHQHVEP